MRRLLPQTLFGQTLLVLLSGIGLALAAGAWIYASARQEAVRAVGALAVAERVINVTRLVAEAPASWRSRLAGGSSDPMFRVALTTTKPVAIADGGANDVSQIIADYIRQSLPGHSVLVDVALDASASPVAGHPFWGSPGGPGNHPGIGGGPMGHGPMMRGPLGRTAMSWRAITAAVELEQGQWLKFATSLPDTGPTTSPRLLLALAVMTGIIALLTAWAVRRMTTPLTLLSEAAARLGRDVEAPALSMAGSVEVRRAASAFNEMQGKLRRLIESRTMMLAAISHDLRTQLTLLRLRAEGAELGEERDRMLKTITDMEDMLAATLSFAREETKGEVSRRVDVSALVSSIVDDMSDTGLAVAAGVVEPAVIAELKPVALSRAITNLIDNAVKYGERATVSLARRGDHIAIEVDDDGPGIPEEQLAKVLQPFYRVEASRNRDTGGIGLGLAIASSIAEAHGGTLKLSNRERKGLRAAIEIYG
ncbi:MAG: ATP-binding protein [Hyphomicrobiaceae bacterium]|nr:ATP-binding protein [Hyphomicrobiaceae bacterium]